MTRRDAKGLGRTQRIVLQLLAIEPKSVRTLVYDGFGISPSSAHAALTTLAKRGFVDRAFQHDTLVYHLTDNGREVADELGAVEEDM